MALAAGTRGAIGRASTVRATAAFSNFSSSRSCIPSPLTPPTCCPNPPPPRKSAVSLRIRMMRRQQVLLSSSSSAAASPSRSIRIPMIASSSSSSPSSSSPPADRPPSVAGAATAVDVDALDIRVGRVLKAWKHPEAASLYIEEVDLAEPEGPRTICSGLVNFLSLEELQGRAVLVLANLKARNMRGVKSNGMLLAASNAEHTIVQLLLPPEGAVPGERVWFGEEIDRATQSTAGTPNQVQKKKLWETLQPLLKTTEDCVVVFQSKPMRTSGGAVTCQSLAGANIS